MINVNSSSSFYDFFFCLAVTKSEDEYGRICAKTKKKWLINIISIFIVWKLFAQQDSLFSSHFFLNFFLLIFFYIFNLFSSLFFHFLVFFLMSMTICFDIFKWMLEQAAKFSSIVRLHNIPLYITANLLLIYIFFLHIYKELFFYCYFNFAKMQTFCQFFFQKVKIFFFWSIKFIKIKFICYESLFYLLSMMTSFN